ncbi:PKD domain-containing protein [Candidatus Latescibacterota bacterium]
MARTMILTIVCAFITFSQSLALERPDVEFKIFQFPPNMIPRIDGNTDDWNIVPDDYIIGTDQLTDESGRRPKGQKPDPKSLDVKVRVGWVKGLNRLYFLYEAYDDYWDMYYRRGDIFELVVDGDLSGGDIIHSPHLKGLESYFRYQGVLGQNYHIFTPPGEGRDWAFIWGCQTWINDLPWANHAYNYDFKEGESGNLVLEFWITPFDYAPYDGPERAVVSKLVEDTIVGLNWVIIDYDAGRDHSNINDDDGFFSLSQHPRAYCDADAAVAFRLMPLLEKFRKSIEAEWSFKVLDMDRRLVAFQDESYGEITSWLWDFDDGTKSGEQHPVHTYTRRGEFVVTLTVEGLAGKARRIKVRDVAVK